MFASTSCIFCCSLLISLRIFSSSVAASVRYGWETAKASMMQTRNASARFTAWITYTFRYLRTEIALPQMPIRVPSPISTPPTMSPDSRTVTSRIIIRPNSSCMDWTSQL